MTFWLVLLFTFFFVRYLLPVVLRAVLGGFVRKTMRNGGFGPQPGPGPGFGAGSQGHSQQHTRQPDGPRPGEVRVDFVPPTASQPGKPPTGFKGGEYVEYEEVK